MIHPDLHLVFPVVKDKRNAEPVSDSFIGEWREFVKNSPWFTLNDWLGYIEVGNAQGLIFASEAAEIIKKLNLKTFEADYKIMIIWLPEKMHVSAANKLLKIIEEPPPKTLFLLVSDEPDKIIPTIVSRCQLIKIPGFTPGNIRNFLVSRYNANEQTASGIARMSGGNINRARELLTSDEPSRQNLDHFKNLMRFAWKRDIISLISWSEEIAGTGRETQKSFISFALRVLRENLMLTLDQFKNDLVFLSGAESSFSANFHPYITLDNIHPLAEEFNYAHSHIESNGNARIIFLDLALKVVRLIRR
jgi:DNA polymerase-3 subunit delta'